MVHVESPQLTEACSNWKSSLRNQREIFTRDKAALQQACATAMSGEQLVQLEHLHNQLHIQLINIHDLKQAIKLQERNIDHENTLGRIRDETYARQEMLQTSYEGLQRILTMLRRELSDFLALNRNPSLT